MAKSNKKPEQNTSKRPKMPAKNPTTSSHPQPSQSLDLSVDQPPLVQEQSAGATSGPPPGSNTTASETPSTPELAPDVSTAVTPPAAPGNQGEQSVPTSVTGIFNELKGMFTNLSLQMTAKMDSVLSEICAVKHDLAETKRFVADIESAVNFNASQITSLEKETIPKMNDEIETKISNVEEKLMLLELHQRKQNLLIYGMPDGKDEDIYKVVAMVICHFLNVSPEEARNIPIINAHRLPSARRDSQPTGPRPIIVRFSHMADRDALLQAYEQPKRGPGPSSSHQPASSAASAHPTQPAPSAQPASPPGHSTAHPRPTPATYAARVGPQPATHLPTLDYSRITIRTDLPPTMKRERGRLASIAFNLRREKKLSTRIRINGTQVYLQTRQTKAGGGPQTPWTVWKE